VEGKGSAEEEANLEWSVADILKKKKKEKKQKSHSNRTATLERDEGWEARSYHGLHLLKHPFRTPAGSAYALGTH